MSNAPFFKEIIERTNQVGSTRIQGKNNDERRANLSQILRQQLDRATATNARTKTY